MGLRGKNQVNTQFARVSTDSGNRTSTTGIADDDGIEPLADDNGRLVVRLFVGDEFVGDGNPLPVEATITPGPDPLDVNIISPIPLPVNITESIDLRVDTSQVSGLPLNIYNVEGLAQYSSNTSEATGYVPTTGINLGSGGGHSKIMSIVGFCDNPVPCYLQLFDMLSLPTSGVTKPFLSYPIAAGPAATIPGHFANKEMYIPITDGTVIALSSTRLVFTALATEYLSCIVVFGEAFLVTP